MQEFVMKLKFNNKEVTPNLNRLSREGIFFSNFYSQVGVGTSSDAEFTFNTSLMPSTKGTVFVNFFDREYVAIPKLLKEKVITHIVCMQILENFGIETLCIKA